MEAAHSSEHQTITVWLTLILIHHVSRQHFNGNFRILKWRYCTIFWAIFCGNILLDRPYTGLTYGRYLQFRCLKFPLSIFQHFLQTSGWPELEHGAHGKILMRRIDAGAWWTLASKAKTPRREVVDVGRAGRWSFYEMFCGWCGRAMPIWLRFTTTWKWPFIVSFPMKNGDFP